MPRNSANSALSMPPWLILLTTVLLVARLLFGAFDTTDQEPALVKWLTLAQVNERHLPNSDLVFYYFSGPVAEASLVMDRTTFRNRKSIQTLNANFVAVHVDDSTDLANVKEKLEVRDLQQKYGIAIFPSVVVVLGDGTLVDSKFGTCSGRVLNAFLDSCQIKAGYCRALKLFVKKPEQCAQQLRQWLDKCDFTNEEAGYATAYAVCGFRMAKDEASAQSVLSLAESKTKKVNHDLWPWLVVRYLNGKLSRKELFEQVEYDQETLTTAKFFVAMDLKSRNNRKESDELLKWIYTEGSRDSEAFKLAHDELNSPEATPPDKSQSES